MLQKTIRFIIPSAFHEWLQWRKLLLACRDFGYKDLERAVQVLSTHYDFRIISGAQAGFQSVLAADPICAAKYLDAGYWLRMNILRAARLGLHTARPKKILDLGCGPGYFLAACRLFGHDAVGLDCPEALLTAIEKEVYTLTFDVLKLTKMESLITPFHPILSGEQFDLITGFMVCFNNHDRESEWCRPEWEWFIGHLLSHLAEDGVIWLELNANRARYGRRLYYDLETLAYFQSLGMVNGKTVTIRNGQ